MVTGHYAGRGGGAVAIGMGSVVSGDKEAFFVNTGNYDGGGVYIVSDPSVSLNGHTSFVCNAANIAEGAL